MQQVFVKATGKLLAILGILFGLGLCVETTSAPAHAAHSLKDTLITVGIGTAAGTVLGLSTLPFYGQPSDHLGNVFIGAGVGLVAGLGVALYLLATPETEESKDELSRDQSYERFYNQQKPETLQSFQSRPQEGWALAVNLVGIRL